MSKKIVKHYRSFSPSFTRLIATLAMILCVTSMPQAETWTTSAEGLQNKVNQARDGDTIQVTGGSTRSQITVNKRLKIEGTGRHTLSGKMLVRASGSVIRNLTFRNVGSGSRSASIFLNGADQARVENNDIAGSRGMGIFVGSSDNVRVTGNKVHDTRCMNGTSGYTTSQGIKVGGGSRRVIVMNNNVEGMQGCRTTAAFYCDTGATDGVFERNRVSRVGRASGDSIGLYVESRCHNWDITDNIVSGVQTGVRNGAPGTGDPNNTLIEGNFIMASEVGVKIIRGRNVIVTNNDITAPIEVKR
jgi:parallel beta-helix repeat protein